MTLTIILTSFASLVAVLAAIFACRAAKSGSVASLSRRFASLQELFETHSDAIGALQENHKALRSRVAMRELRARKIEAMDPPTPPTDEDEKARVRRELSAKLANGSIKPIGR